MTLILKPTSNRPPYILTLVQKVKNGAYKIHAFINEAIVYQDSASYFDTKNDVYFLHGLTKGKGTLISKCHTFSTI